MRIQVLQERANGIKPCKNSIRDNDNTTMQAATNSIRCITSYWRRFVDTTYNNHVLACDRSDQYNEIASLLLNNSENTNFTNGMKFYTQPCIEMKIWTTLDNRNVRAESQNMWITLYCNSNEVQEIENNRAFTPTTCGAKLEMLLDICRIFLLAGNFKFHSQNR